MLLIHSIRKSIYLYVYDTYFRGLPATTIFISCGHCGTISTCAPFAEKRCGATVEPTFEVFIIQNI